MLTGNEKIIEHYIYTYQVVYSVRYIYTYQVVYSVRYIYTYQVVYSVRYILRSIEHGVLRYVS